MGLVPDNCQDAPADNSFVAYAGLVCGKRMRPPGGGRMLSLGNELYS